MSAQSGLVKLGFDYETQSGFSNTAPGLPGTAYSTMRVKVNGNVVTDVNGVSWHGLSGSLVYDLSSSAGDSMVAVTFETACKYNSNYSSGAYGDYVWIDNVCAFNVNPCTYYGIDAVVTADVSCNGGADGSASATVLNSNGFSSPVHLAMEENIQAVADYSKIEGIYAENKSKIIISASIPSKQLL